MANGSETNRQKTRLEEIEAKMAEMEAVLNRMPQLFGAMLGLSPNDRPEPPVLKSFDLNGAVEYMSKCSKIIVMVGAGISTSAGIPDYRTPGTGLYSQLEKENLPNPETVSSLEYFLKKPEHLFLRFKPLYLSNYKPTPAHYFIRLLHEKGKLLRVFTQNIDSLEKAAGIPSEKLVQAHGTFVTSHCFECAKEYSLEYVRENVVKDQVPCCNQCSGIIKPDIVLFGEDLPKQYKECASTDFPTCDFLIIMGTSLQVAPFNLLITRVNKTCPRLLINMEPAGTDISLWGPFTDGLRYDLETNSRDVFHKSSCDDGVIQMAKLLGWQNDFDKLIGKASITEQINQSTSREAQTTVTRRNSSVKCINGRNRSVSPRKATSSSKPSSMSTSSSNKTVKNKKIENK